MKNYYLFLAAIAVTFGFIAALQFIAFPWFFAALLAMHVGVFLFIVSKKRFQNAAFSFSASAALSSRKGFLR